jgi:hypothetical protein
MSLRVIRSVGRVLEVRVELAPWSRHGDLARFATADHAALVEIIIRELVALGWEARAEVSFSEYGERGFVDILAWHASTRTLLVIEVKTRIVDVGETAGVLDRKRRLAPRIAAGLGWDAGHIANALIVRAGRTNERRVGDLRATLAGSLPSGTRAFRAWLRHPKGVIGAVAFWPVAIPPNSRRRAARRPARLA